MEAVYLAKIWYKYQCFKSVVSIPKHNKEVWNAAGVGCDVIMAFSSFFLQHKSTIVNVIQPENSCSPL